ncbi:hypothetical protein CAI21_10395 [Alkalilimnicola ehrlichii]|uniref:CAAX prenyl protease 2/Lysostaphin resistance protein A-like domain-containing protein n=1 Tax=Alkalilimnicola ehrlichii TaxID=351052 RepID=A0A3E0WV76_9GAMM|nr:hypothetical protein CAI21_10395 [Alkalilimnicola ehrlichii]RFA36083.1 hypothetical protein CAL65_11545 [Alkalilimnicola ehrlichii]
MRNIARRSLGPGDYFIDSVWAGPYVPGTVGVIQTAVIGVVFARLVLRWGSLWPVIIAHALLNSFSLIMFRVLAGLE